VKTSLNDIDYDYDEFRQKIKDKIDEIIENNPNVSAEFLSEPLYELKEMMVELEEHYDLCDNVNKLDSIVDDLNNEIDV
jgi:predicted nuclease with TOPRIM domain